MRRALLIHGTPSQEEYFHPDAPSPSNAHWFPWLQKQLLMEGIEAQTPEMPLAFKPDYDLWSATFERFPIETDTLLVGHSCGGGFLLRWLTEHLVVPERTVLVAPWIDPDGNHCVPGFFDFTIDPLLATRTELHIIFSDNDSSDVDRSVQIILDEIPRIHQHFMPGKGHFVSSGLGSDTFPELREIVLGR